MEEYIDKVGSIDKGDLKDKSFGDVTDFIKDEVQAHHDIIAERTENAVRTRSVYSSRVLKMNSFRRMQPPKVDSNLASI